MPIYEYSCGKCGKQFEMLIRKESDVPGKCPKCGAPEVRKAFSTFAVSMGSGDAHSHCSECPSADGGSCASAGSCPFSGD